MSITLARPADWSYVLHLSQKHAEELGFIPAAAMQNYLHRGRVRLARENGDPVGFFLHGGLHASQVRIFQACTQLDARGLKHGIALLSSLIADAAAQNCRFLSLHCRDGLESNGFWSACGFTSAGCYPGGKARGKIVHEWHLNINDALSNPTLPYAADWIKRLSQIDPAAEGSSPSASFPRTPQELARLFGIETYLDSEEANVTTRTTSIEQPRTLALEALRSLDIAATHP